MSRIRKRKDIKAHVRSQGVSRAKRRGTDLRKDHEHLHQRFEEAFRVSNEGFELYDNGALSDAVKRFEQVLEICHEVGVQQLEAVILTSLGHVYVELNRPQETLRYLEQALSIYCQMKDKTGEATTLSHLGLLYHRLGQAQKALSYYQQALPILRKLGDHQGEGIILQNLGVLYHQLGQLQEALPSFKQALTIWRTVGAHHAEGTTLHNIGRVYLALDRLKTALTHFEQALPILRNASDHKVEGDLLHNLGMVYERLGRTEEALEYFEQALSIARTIGDRQGEGATLNVLGQLYSDWGRPQEARSYLEQALTVRHEVGDHRGEGVSLNNLGLLFHRLGQFQEALAYYQRAGAIARRIGNHCDEGQSLHNMGGLFRQLVQHQEALTLYEQALSLRRMAGDRRGEGRTLHNLGVLHQVLGRNHDSLIYLEQSLILRREIGDRQGEGATLCGLGTLYRILGRQEEALAHHKHALTIQRLVGDRQGEGVTLYNLGVLYHNLGQFQESLSHYEQSLHLARIVGSRQDEWHSLYQLGVLYHELGRRQEALTHIEQAIALVESIRGEILSEELRLSYFGTAQNLYHDYVLLLVEQRDVDQAFHAAERRKARAFLDMLAESHLRIQAGVAPDLWEEEQRLLGERRVIHQRLIDQRSQLLKSVDNRIVAELQQREQELERAYLVNQAEIRRRNPGYAALIQPEAWQLHQIQQEVLDEHTALLEYVLGEGISFLFVVLKDDFAVFLLPSQKEIEIMVQELRAAVVYQKCHYPHGYELYQMLVEPAEHLIQSKELMIVADGVLHYLPFALLLTESSWEVDLDTATSSGSSRMQKYGNITDRGSRDLLPTSEEDLEFPISFHWANLPYLIRRHALRYVPSATVAGLLRREVHERHQRISYNGQFAAFANPITIGRESAQKSPASATLQAAINHIRVSLGYIPHTSDEIWGIAELMAPGMLPSARSEVFENEVVHLRTGAAATKQAVIDLTCGEKAYRFFHIASHGLLDPEKPLFSGLVFTQNERYDPFWHTIEIFNAHIPSELVVLAACETGLGKIMNGEGIVGLTRAFLYAGANTVCVSLWKILDESTPRLMQVFYEAIMHGTSKAEALRAAQLKLLSEGRWTHPYNWAPFVLIGER